MATKLECFILHRSEVVLTLALLYSHALSTEKHIFHKFLTRQIAHRSHHSALVILILFTPIKKRTAKHRAGRHESPQLCSLPTPGKEGFHWKTRAWEVLGKEVTLFVYPFPSPGSCMAAEILRSCSPTLLNGRCSSAPRKTPTGVALCSALLPEFCSGEDV